MSSTSGRVVATLLYALIFPSRVSTLTFTARDAARTIELPLYQDANQLGYLTNISIGTPPQDAVVLVDTGSSDLWIFSDDVDCRPAGVCQGSAFDPARSSTFRSVAPNDFLITYAGGNGARGDYISDTVHLGGVSVDNVVMGLASLAVSPNGLAIQGIMGLGMLLDEALSSENQTGYFNLPYRLTAAGLIGETAFSVYLNDIRSQVSSLLFGGVDSDKYSGELAVFDVTPTSAGLNNYLIPITSLSLVGPAGNATALNLPNQSSSSSSSSSATGFPALLDTGSTAISLPSSAVSTLYSYLPVTETNLGPVVPCSLRNSGNALTFRFGGSSGATIAVDIAQAVRPSTLLANRNLCFLDIYPLPRAASTVAILGDSFLRSTYVVFDPGNAQVGIAQARLNATGSNVEALQQNVPVPTGVAILPVAQLGDGATYGGGIPGSTVRAGGAQATASVTAVRTSGVLPTSALAGLPTEMATAATRTEASASVSAAAVIPTFSGAAESLEPAGLAPWMGVVVGAFMLA